MNKNYGPPDSDSDDDFDGFSFGGSSQQKVNGGSKYISYGPPQTDSEDDDYDGFSFGNHPEVQKERKSFFVVDVDEEMYNAVMNGELQKLEKEINTINFDVNEPLKGGYTLLHHACNFGHLNIVEYLIYERNANPNCQIDSVTPLMQACCCTKNELIVTEIVKILLKEGAVVNVSDKYGMTPFLFACKTGITSVVQLLIKEASLEARDNRGNTALFYAVEYNHPEIVKLLIDANVDLDCINGSGFTARQVAEYENNDKVLEMFPLEEYKYFVPASYLSYNSIHDLIPQIFRGKTEIENNDTEESIAPEYFPEIHSILLKMQMERFLEKFAEAKMNLNEFLTVTDDKLKEIGIEYPIHRNIILMGILNFYLYHWSKSSIAKVKGKEKENFYDVLMLLGSCLKNTVIVDSSVVFVQRNIENNHFGNLSENVVRSFRESVNGYKKEIKELEKTCKYLHSFLPKKPPIYIDYDTVSRQKKSLKKYFKYSLIFIGLSVAICLKTKNIIKFSFNKL